MRIALFKLLLVLLLLWLCLLRLVLEVVVVDLALVLDLLRLFEGCFWGWLNRRWLFLHFGGIVELLSVVLLFLLVSLFLLFLLFGQALL